MTIISRLRCGTCGYRVTFHSHMKKAVCPKCREFVETKFLLLPSRPVKCRECGTRLEPVKTLDEDGCPLYDCPKCGGRMVRDAPQEAPPRNECKQCSGTKYDGNPVKVPVKCPKCGVEYKFPAAWMVEGKKPVLIFCSKKDWPDRFRMDTKGLEGKGTLITYEEEAASVLRKMLPKHDVRCVCSRNFRLVCKPIGGIVCCRLECMVPEDGREYTNFLSSCDRCNGWIACARIDHVSRKEGHEMIGLICTKCGKQMGAWLHSDCGGMVREDGKGSYVCGKCNQHISKDSRRAMEKAADWHEKGFRYVCPHCGKETKGKQSAESLPIRYMDGQKPVLYQMHKVLCTECGKDMIFLRVDTKCLHCKRPVTLARASEHPSRETRDLFCPWCGEMLSEKVHVGCGGIIREENAVHHGPLSARADLICSKCKKRLGEVVS